MAVINNDLCLIPVGADFFREMLKRVKEKENLNRKNKTAEEKEQVKSLKSKIALNAENRNETFCDECNVKTA